VIERALLSPRVALQIRNRADIAVLSVEQQHSRIVPSELGPIDLAAPRTQLIFPRLEMAARAADIDLYVVALHRLMRMVAAT
jgi:hypothetical protein